MAQRHRERSEATPLSLVRPYRIAKCLFVSLALVISARAQTKTFFNISKYERRWALFHPFAARKIKKHQQEMYAVYHEVKKSKVLDAYASGGRLDAFRHVFAMAYFVRFVKPHKLRKLGRAHERDNHLHFRKGILEEGELPDSIATVMDLQNNEIGITLGCENGKLSIEELKLKAIDKIKAGGAFILLRDSTGRYMDCSGRVIDPEELKGAWRTPRCLATSDY